MNPWEMDWGSKKPQDASEGALPWELDWGSGGAQGRAQKASQALQELSYESMLSELESGGDPEAQATTSSATGLHQFTEKTWLNTVRDAAPEWAQGLDRDQILASRSNPKRSSEMEAALRNQNIRELLGKKVEVNNANLYAAHHFGPGVASKFAQANENTPMATLLSPAQLEANAYLRKMTKADVLENWAERAGNKPWLRDWGK